MSETILIIDDNEDWCRLIAKRLSNEGYVVPWTTKTGILPDLLRTVAPACVLLDLTLSDDDGISVLKQIKSSNPELPVIMLTACNTVNIAVQVMKEGAFYYLEKTCDPKELKKTIKQALQERDRKKGSASLSLPVTGNLTLSDTSRLASAQVERQLIIDTLSKTSWHKGKTAKLLGVDPKTLYNKMKAHRILKKAS